MPRTKAVHVRLDPDLMKALDESINRISSAAAQEDGGRFGSRSQIIRIILRQWVGDPDQQNITAELLYDINHVRKPVIQRIVEILNETIESELPTIMDFALNGDAFQEM